MKKKFIACILTASMITSILYGCGQSDDPVQNLSKAQLVEEYKKLEAQYNATMDQYDTLNKMYNANTNTDNPTSEISVMGDGSGRLTLNSIDSSIIFPESFQYPGTTPVAATGKLDIIENVSVTPGTNWILKMNGSSLEMQHTGGISGTILVGSIPSNYDVNQLQYDVLDPWFQTLGVTPLYKEIFIQKYPYGVQASAPIMIDSESAYLRCGMVGYAGISLIYIFVYRGPQDSIKDESVMSVINSIAFNKENLTVDP